MFACNKTATLGHVEIFSWQSKRSEAGCNRPTTITMTSNSSSTFALPPLPVGDRRPKSIAEFIARVNAERGGFRNVTQDSLQKEIEDETNGLVESKDVDMKDDPEAGDAADQVDLLDFRKTLDEVHMQAKYACHACAHPTYLSASLPLAVLICL